MGRDDNALGLGLALLRLGRRARGERRCVGFKYCQPYCQPFRVLPAVF